MQINSDITVLFAADFPIFRRTVKKLLEDTQNMHVVCAETVNDVFPLADDLCPQIAVLDLNVDFEKLCELAGGLSLRSIPTLLIGDDLDESKALELIQHGVSGVVPRTTSREMLCKSVWAVASGEIWISRRAVTDLVQWVRTTQPNSPETTHDSIEVSAALPDNNANAAQTPENRFHLTRRELQIVEAIREGMTNIAISAHLAISKNTVKQHLANIFDKCGVSSRLELAMIHDDRETAPSPAVSSTTRLAQTNNKS